MAHNLELQQIRKFATLPVSAKQALVGYFYDQAPGGAVFKTRKKYCSFIAQRPPEGSKLDIYDPKRISETNRCCSCSDNRGLVEFGIR